MNRLISVAEILQDDVVNEANPTDTTPVKLLDTDSKIDNKSIVEKLEISMKDDSKLKGGNTSETKFRSNCFEFKF